MKQQQVGFTLVELIVVLVILSIFAGMMSLSVGSSEVRKNRAFYEHILDSLQYIRLLSAERMQPMGLVLQADKAGNLKPVVVSLSDAYINYQLSEKANQYDAVAKNAMELSAMNDGTGKPTPKWSVEPDISLPDLPPDVTLDIAQLDKQNTPNQRQLQPWFTGQDVPQVMWFGTGQATPVNIDIRYKNRPIGETIVIMPDGQVQIGHQS